MNTEQGRPARWTLVLAGFALVAFAANSVLCRLALGGSAIDATSFTVVRLASGAVTLSVLSFLFRKREPNGDRGTWKSAFALFLYAAPFSFAYLGLATGTGALILFGSVQATMLIAAVAAGERPHAFEWLGLTMAIGGLIYLVLPGLDAPPLQAAALMALAGIAWGWYSLKGRGGRSPLATTAGNFSRTIPFALLLCALFFKEIHASTDGLLLAIASGSAASGLGYAVWYAALRDLTATRAAIIQLSVPILAAGGGVLFLSEEVSFRLVVSGLAILGGVGLAVSTRTS